MISALFILLWTIGIADAVEQARESYQNLLVPHSDSGKYPTKP